MNRTTTKHVPTIGNVEFTGEFFRGCMTDITWRSSQYTTAQNGKIANVADEISDNDFDGIQKLYYEFKEVCSGGSAPCYLLILNGSIYRTYLKTKYSKDVAEEKAQDEVIKSIKKYGMDRVTYDGAFLIVT